MEVIYTLEDITLAAEKLIEQLLNTDIKAIAFKGEMGAGKTTLIKTICQKMGVSSTISSPTFSIINEYTTSDGHTIFHMDLYRVKDEEEAIAAGVEDCLYSGSLCLVEWPDKILHLLPANTLKVKIASIDSFTRKITIP